MQYWLIRHNLDLAAFAVATIGLALAMDRLWLRRQAEGRGFPKLLWILLVLNVFAGSFWAVRAGRLEQHRLTDMVAGIAPTYAAEMTRHGIEQIGLDTPHDDPAYLELIDRQIEWLHQNPNIADIYTFVRAADGGIALLIDSETDYDRNGRYDSEREARVPIGEPYRENAELIDRAFAGASALADEPTSDRWGTWVSSFVPIRSSAGDVIGVLGVDYCAERWIQAIFSHRAAMLGLGGVVTLILIGFSAAVMIQRGEVDRRARIEALLVSSRLELSQLTDALHKRAEQRASELAEAHRATEAAIRAKNAAAIAFCDRLRREAAHSAAHPSLMRCIDAFEDLARLENGELDLPTEAASTPQVLGCAISQARARLAGRQQVDITFQSPIPATLTTNARRVSDIIVEACEMVAQADDGGCVRVDVEYSDVPQPAGALKFHVFGDCDRQRESASSRLFSGRPPEAIIEGAELGDTWKVAKQVIEALGGTLTISRRRDCAPEIHFSIAAGCPDGVEFLDPSVCASRVAA